jgi:hypothetical protein
MARGFVTSRPEVMQNLVGWTRRFSVQQPAYGPRVPTPRGNPAGIHEPKLLRLKLRGIGIGS